MPELEDLAAQFSANYPDLDPDELRRRFIAANALGQQRGIEAQRQGETAGQYIGRRSIPFTSSLTNFFDTNAYSAARERMDSGSYQPGDASMVANYERTQEIDQDRGLLGQIGSGLAHVPALVGETMTAGAVIGRLPMLGQAPQLISRAAIGSRAGFAGAVARNAATTAVVPSMYLPQAAQRAAEQGGEWYSPSNLAPSFLMGAAQTAVLGSLPQAGTYIQGSGIMPVLGRLAARTVTGMGEQQGVDVLAGAVDNLLPEAYQFRTRYGLVGHALRGEWGELGKHSAIQAVTFAAFSALHPVLHGEPSVQARVESAAPTPGVQPTVAPPVPAQGRQAGLEAMPPEQMGMVSLRQQQTRAMVESPPIEPMPIGMRAQKPPIDTTATVRPAQLAGPSAAIMDAYEAAMKELAPKGTRKSAREKAAQTLLNIHDAVLNGADRRPDVVQEAINAMKLKEKTKYYANLLIDTLSPKAESTPLSAEDAEALMKPLREGEILPKPPETAVPQKPPEASPAAPQPPVAQLPAKPPPEAQEAAKPAVSKAPKATLRDLWERSQAGEKISQEEINKTAGWDTREAKIIWDRIAGRTQEAIGEDLGVSRERVRQIEKAALDKTGELHESIAESIHKANKENRAIDDIEQGKAVPATDVHTDPKEVEKKVADAKTRREQLQDHIQKISNQLMKEIEDAAKTGRELSEERRAIFADEVNAIDYEARTGKPPEGRKPYELPERAKKGKAAKPTPAGEQAQGVPATPATQAVGRIVRGPKRSGSLDISALRPIAEWFRGFFTSKEITDANSELQKTGRRPLTQEDHREIERLAREQAEVSDEEIYQALRSIPTHYATGFKNEAVDVAREASGMPPVEKIKPETKEEFWAQARKVISDHPAAGMDKVNDYATNVRGIESGLDQALIGHERISTARQYDKLLQKQVDAIKSGDRDQASFVNMEAGMLRGRLDLIDQVLREGGSFWHEIGMARQLLVNEDFSLSRMINERIAAKGKPLTEAETVEIADLHKKINELQEQVDAQTGVPGKEEITKQSELEHAKRQFKERNLELQAQERPAWVKAASYVSKWRRGFLLSGPVTLAKLSSAAVQRMVFTPMENALGVGIGKIIPKVYEKAVYEGKTTFAIEAKAATEGFMRIMDDVKSIMKTGEMDIGLLYGKKHFEVDKSFSDYIGRLHGALKTIPKRAAFERAMVQGHEAALKAGLDITDPLVQMRLGVEAYKLADRAIFQQDNWAVSAWKRAMQATKDPTTGKESTGSVVRRTIGEIALPIIKVPTNIVFETFQHAFGLVSGGARLADAYSRGIETLHPQQADVIMRELKKGAVGAAVMALGYFLRGSLGGFYEPGEKRDKDDVSFGAIKIGGIEIPSYLTHNPLLSVLQMGATIGRIADKKIKGHEQGLAVGSARALLGLIEETPFVREMHEISKYTGASPGSATGELTKSLLVPQALQWGARQIDRTEGEQNKRKATGFMERIQSGVPGWRQGLERIDPDVEQVKVKLTHLRAARENHMADPGTLGRVFARQQELHRLERLNNKINELENIIQGKMRARIGLRQLPTKPEEERIRSLRQAIARLAKAALEASDRARR